MKKTTAFITTLLLVFTFSAQTVAAYTSTAQLAAKVTNTTGIYLIEFVFGHEDHDIYIPVIARPSDTLEQGYLSYHVMDDEGEIARGTTAGIVLSDAELVHNQYKVPKDTSATFTLLVFFTASQDEIGTEFWTQVTGLPFSFDGTEELQLNPSELQYYKTPSLEFVDMPVTISSVDIYYSALNNDSPQPSLSSNTIGVNTHLTAD